MEKASYHTHTTGSDGKLSPRQLIESAISKGFKTLAITDHYFRTKGVDKKGWASEFYTDEHYAELRRLQKEYDGKIKILVGVEFDWFEGKEDWTRREVNRRDYDIKLVSVHRILIKGDYYVLLYLEEIFEEALAALDGDIKKLVGFYYRTLREGIQSGLFDVVGHFDVMKHFNKDSKYFSEDEEWYRAEVLKTLKVVKKFGLKVEVNLRGFIEPCGMQWPSKWIIDKAKEMGIGLVVGTDAHYESELDYDLDVVEKLLGEV